MPKKITDLDPALPLTGAEITPLVQNTTTRRSTFGALADWVLSVYLGYDGGTVQDVLDSAKPMQSYTALRAYTGRATAVRITTPGIAGYFQRDSDVVTADNGGTVIVDASGRRWKRVFDGAVSVKWFGAVGDGVTDDTAAIQAALNSGVLQIYFPEGTYLFKNLTIPNSRMVLFGDGKWKTILQCANPVSTDYGIASSAYVNNSTFGSEPVTLRNLCVNGSNLVSYPLAIYGYYSDVDTCRVVNAKAGGHALKFTANGISESACSTTLVENKLINSILTGGDGGAFIISDTVAKCTDMVTTGNIFNGAASFTSMAGHCVTDNHFYGDAITMNKLSTGTVVNNNYFENELTLDDFKDEVIGLSGNRFVSRVSVDFGVGGEVCVFDGCLWQGPADLYHNYFASNKRIIVNGGGFETATPMVFHNGSSTGIATFNGVWSQGLGFMLEGTRTGGTGAIRSVVIAPPAVGTDRGDNSRTLTWGVDAATQRWSTTLTANRTITLSTTSAVNGARFRVRRLGGGAFTLDVGGLKNLSISQWCDVEYDGSAWILSAYGTL
jgi:Pectate lyase superfamily protein